MDCIVHAVAESNTTEQIFTHTLLPMQSQNIFFDILISRAESEEELKSLLMKVKEESEKVGLKLMASGPITSWQIDGKTMATVTDFIFLGLQNHCRW